MMLVDRAGVEVLVHSISISGSTEASPHYTSWSLSRARAAVSAGRAPASAADGPADPARSRGRRGSGGP
jgi:hypothetical protein